MAASVNNRLQRPFPFINELWYLYYLPFYQQGAKGEVRMKGKRVEQYLPELYRNFLPELFKNTIPYESAAN